MASDLLPINNDSYLDIDHSVAEFRSTLPADQQKGLFDALSGIVSIKVSDPVNEILLGIHKNIQNQVKQALNLPDYNLLGLTLPRKLHSYNHNFVIQSFKDQLSAISATGEATLAN